MRNDYDKFYVKIQYALNPMVIMSWVGIDEHTFRVSCKKVLIFYFFLHMCGFWHRGIKSYITSYETHVAGEFG